MDNAAVNRFHKSAFVVSVFTNFGICNTEEKAETCRVVK